MDFQVLLSMRFSRQEDWSDCHFLLQGILPTQGLHQSLLHCRWFFTTEPPGKPIQVSSVQLLSCVQLFATPWTAAHQASLSITNSWSLLKLLSIESVMPSNLLILCHPILLLLLIFPSIRVFSSESVLCIWWPKYWSFSFSTSPSNEYSGLIYFRIDWFDFLTVQGTLKSLLWNHSSKAPVLWHSAFFKVQFSPLCMTAALK